MTIQGNDAKKAAIYMRYSNSKQTEYSIKNQYEGIKEYADTNGYEITDVFIDRAKTGTNSKRKGYNDLVNELKAGKKWDVILIYHTSRLARKTTISFSSHDFANLNQVPIIFTSQPQCNGFSTATILTRGIQFLIDENQSLTNSDFTHDTMCIKAKGGHFLGGMPPLGYDVCEYKSKSGLKIKKLVINEKEAYIIRRIFQMYLAGVSYTEMARELNNRGLKTKTGGKFTKNSFYEILKREKYMGTYTWNISPGENSLRKRFQPEGDYPEDQQIHAEDMCPAIISKEQFELVQKKLRESNYGKSSAKNRRHYLLTGMGVLKCGVCGATMYGETATTHGRKYLTYNCPNHKKGLCPTKAINEEPLDTFVVKVILRETLESKSVHELNKLIFNNQFMCSIKEEKNALECKLSNLAAAIEYHASENLLKQFKQYEESLEIINHKIQTGEYVIEIQDSEKKAFLKNVSDYMCNSESVDVRLFLNNVIKEINICNDDVEVRLNVA